MPLWKKVPPDRCARPRSILTGHDGSAEAVAIAPDRTWLVTTSWDGTARIWAANGKPRATLTGHKEAEKTAAARGGEAGTSEGGEAKHRAGEKAGTAGEG